MKPPQILIIAGPNGAGKSTSVPGLLSQETTFLNADEIAKGLPGLATPARDVQAGRLLLQQLDELEAQQADIAVETTLSSRTLAPRMTSLSRSSDAGMSRGYATFSPCVARSPTPGGCRITPARVNLD